MSDIGITATAAGIGVASATALGINAARSSSFGGVGTAGIGLAAGAVVGATAAWAISRDDGPGSSVSPWVALPAAAGAALVGAMAYGHTRSIATIGESLIAAAGPALLAGTAAAGGGALMYSYLSKGDR